MRNAIRTFAIVSSAGAALALACPSAHAYGPNPTVNMSAPEPNMAIVSITNRLDDSTSCGARLYGFEEYDTPYTTVAPRSTITFTMTNVPAGNYSVWWACDGYTGDKRLISVGGNPHLEGEPQTAISTA